MTIESTLSRETSPAREERLEDTPPCAVCGSGSVLHMRLAGEQELRRCTNDGLIFAWPLDLPAGPKELFADAYTGKIADAEMEMFHHRLIWRADILRSPKATAAALAPVQGKALEYIKSNYAPGSPVLDIGCGSGLFAQTVQGAGYDVHGVEVAGPVVEFLQSVGFDAFHGTVDDVPDGRFDPVVCTSFFVLHHVTDPVDFLSTIRRKFPRASLVLSEHYFGRHPYDLGSLNLPPRRLTCWNPDSLALALEKAGFQPKSIDIIEAEPYHPMVDSRAMRLYCRARKIVPAAIRPALVGTYIEAKRRLFGATRRFVGYKKFLGQEHLLAIAEPR